MAPAMQMELIKKETGAAVKDAVLYLATSLPCCWSTDLQGVRRPPLRISSSSLLFPTLHRPQWRMGPAVQVSQVLVESRGGCLTCSWTLFEPVCIQRQPWWFDLVVADRRRELVGCQWGSLAGRLSRGGHHCVSAPGPPLPSRLGRQRFPQSHTAQVVGWAQQSGANLLSQRPAPWASWREGRGLAGWQSGFGPSQAHTLLATAWRRVGSGGVPSHSGSTFWPGTSPVALSRGLRQLHQVQGASLVLLRLQLLPGQRVTLDQLVGVEGRSRVQSVSGGGGGEGGRRGCSGAGTSFGPLCRVLCERCGRGEQVCGWEKWRFAVCVEEAPLSRRWLGVHRWRWVFLRSLLGEGARGEAALIVRFAHQLTVLVISIVSPALWPQSTPQRGEGGVSRNNRASILWCSPWWSLHLPPCLFIVQQHRCRPSSHLLILFATCPTRNNRLLFYLLFLSAFYNFLVFLFFFFIIILLSLRPRSSVSYR